MKYDLSLVGKDDVKSVKFADTKIVLENNFWYTVFYPNGWMD